MEIDKNWKIKTPENANIATMLSWPPLYYKKRLQKIGFQGKNTRLLDAGCGAGHWSAAASYGNKEVYGIDATEKYMTIARDIQKSLKIAFRHANLKLKIGHLEKLPYPDDYFDFVISYCVWMYTDRPKSLSEMYRVLKPGGKIYLGAVAGLGWYLKLIWQGLKTGDRHLLIISLRAIKNRIQTHEKEARQLLQNQRFKILDFGADGQIGNPKIKVRPIYGAKFLGFWNVYEILAEKN